MLHMTFIYVFGINTKFLIIWAYSNQNRRLFWQIHSFSSLVFEPFPLHLAWFRGVNWKLETSSFHSTSLFSEHQTPYGKSEPWDIILISWLHVSDGEGLFTRSYHKGVGTTTLNVLKYFSINSGVICSQNNEVEWKLEVSIFQFRPSLC